MVRRQAKTGKELPVVTKTSSTRELPAIVSLFCGAGGLDWGFKKHGFSIPLAFDLSEAAIRTHKRNFKTTNSLSANLVDLGPSGVLAQVREHFPLGSPIGVIGGPPCQGFSRANTNAKKSDPRNKLPSLYLKIVEILQAHYDVKFVVFENVLGIRDKKHAQTYRSIVMGLESLGFFVTEKELCALDYGVAQNRRRIILSALQHANDCRPVSPRRRKGPRTVRAAIAGLVKPAFFRRGLRPDEIPLHPNHWTMNPKSSKFSEPSRASFEGRSFKRLDWHKPAPTIAFGHREIHVHPNGRRRLSIFEAMLLQGFPPKFVLEGNLSEQVDQVSNAVPPPLASSVASAIKRALHRSSV